MLYASETYVFWLKTIQLLYLKDKNVNSVSLPLVKVEFMGYTHSHRNKMEVWKYASRIY